MTKIKILKIANTQAYMFCTKPPDVDLTNKDILKFKDLEELHIHKNNKIT